MFERKTAEPSGEMGLCPNCDAQIPLDAARCRKCSAEFGGTNLWKVKPLPPHTLATDIQEQLALAARYRDKRNYLMLWPILAGAAVGIVAAIAIGGNGKSIFMSIVFACSMAGYWIGLREKPARCPKCSFLWLYREDRHDMVPPDYPETELTDWKACPGCGLPMK